MESSFTSNDHAKAHCFFKIIVSEICSNSKLMIPENFIRKYGEELKGCVQLKAPGGAPWQADVQRKKGQVWLQNGWPEFATFYSLCFGHSVLFEYQGNCNFKVVIFDTSATEIDYPLRSEKRRRECENDEVSACQKKRVLSGCEETCHVGDCLMRKGEKSADIEIASHANGIGHSSSRMKKSIKLEVDLNNPVQQHYNIRAKDEGKSASKKESINKALASANAFKSSYPFFIKVMKPSFVGKTFGWYAKKADLKAYMRDDIEVLILRLGGRTWLIKCRFQSNRVKMGCGWQQFAEDNALAVGDVCVFELVKPSKKFLQVTIYRAAA